jgi:hypothetical protein
MGFVTTAIHFRALKMHAVTLIAERQFLKKETFGCASLISMKSSLVYVLSNSVVPLENIF